MANQIIKGKDLMLFDGTTGKSFAYATNHSLSISAETSDISSKDHGIWGASEIAKFSWEITSENLFTETDYNTMFTKMMAGTAIDVKFGIKTTNNKTVSDSDFAGFTASTHYYTGKVFITSLQANANNGENATYSITLTGSGALKYV